MSQSVQLDMEVLQRIKFLMEYDVMKTSSENILFEQDLGLKGKTIAPSAKPPMGFGKSVGGHTEKSLEEFTVEVRNFMSDWKTATVETLATILGVGIPLVVTANGFWLTLEVIQAVKGNPDYLSLVFAFIATATAGSQSAVLKPLYRAVGSVLKGGGKGILNILDAIYQYSKKTGTWDTLKPMLEEISKKSKSILEGATTVFEWVNYIFGNSQLGIKLSSIKTFISSVIKTFDDWLASKVIQAGVNANVAQKVGSATRWAGVPFVVNKGIQFLDSNSPSINPNSIPTRKVAYGSYLPN
jgi:hypothetical protein